MYLKHNDKHGFCIAKLCVICFYLGVITNLHNKTDFYTPLDKNLAPNCSTDNYSTLKVLLCNYKI